MTDPVLMKDGVLYIDAHIHEWLDKGDYTPPMAREQIRPSDSRADPTSKHIVQALNTKK